MHGEHFLRLTSLKGFVEAGLHLGDVSSDSQLLWQERCQTSPDKGSVCWLPRSPPLQSERDDAAVNGQRRPFWGSAVMTENRSDDKKGH